jgi:hypothetical protein
MPIDKEERIELFEPSKQTKRLMGERLSELLSSHQRIVLRDYISPENHLAYKHGAAWDHPANDFSEPGKMEEFRAEYSVPFQRIVDADMTLLTESISSIGEQMKNAFVRSIYQMVNEACDRSGNVVTGKTLPESFLEALEKVEFSVDAEGNVELPQFHVGNKDFVRILEEQPEEFGKHVEEIKQRKSKQALEKERERKNRYKAHR